MSQLDRRTEVAIAEARITLLKAQLRAVPLLLAKAIVIIAILLAAVAAG